MTISKNKFLINSYLLLLKNVDDENKRIELINKIELLLKDYENGPIFDCLNDDIDEEIMNRIQIYLVDKQYTSATDIWVNCLHKDSKIDKRTAIKINGIIRQLSGWNEVGSVRISRIDFNYHGRGFKKEVSDL